MQKFNYHSHTYRCGHADLDMKDEEYVLEYIKMGFKKVAFTDHCPQKNRIDKRPNMRMDYDQKEGYIRSINKLKEKYENQIEIESGYEIEYLPGEEENLKELKREVDKIILGQHFIYDDNKNLKIFVGRDNITDEELIRYAKYLDKAMELGLPDIIAHPDVYMMNRNEFSIAEAKTAEIICKSAEEYNIPLEINLAKIYNHTYYKNQDFDNLSKDEQKQMLSKVLYPCRGFWEIATKYNVKVTIGIDVHHKGQISRWNELIKLAEEIIGKDILDKLEFIEDEV